MVLRDCAAVRSDKDAEQNSQIKTGVLSEKTPVRDRNLQVVESQ
jgi:hypothetical protein